MNFASLLLEIRKRARALEQGMAPAVALDQAVQELLGPPGKDTPEVPKRILAALVGIGEGEDFDTTVLRQLSPEDVLHLDLLISAIVDHGLEEDVVPQIRRGLIRRVH